MELRQYQKDCLAKVLWGLTIDGNNLCVLPTGAGKSVVIAHLAKELNKDILILQPNRELTMQNVDKLAPYVDEKEIGIFSASLDSKVVARYTFATIGSIYKKPELFAHFDVIIIDECFIAGTKVSGKKIEDIDVGDIVNSFNHGTGKIEQKRVLAVSKKWHIGDLTNINDGLIVSTGNHPIYIKDKGYVKASEVSKQDKIIFYKSDLFCLPERHNKRNEYRHNGSLVCKKMQFQKKEQGFLFKSMFACLEKLFIVKKNVKGQSDVLQSYPGKNVQYFEEDRSQTQDAGRKWQGNDLTAKNIAGDIGRSMVSGTYNNNRQRIPSPSLQDRHWQPDKKNRDRGGWWFSSFFGCKKTGLSERCIFEVKRVESVSVQKSGNNEQPERGCWVYNLEVEDNNNYFANGVLVHNCHLVQHKTLDGMFGKLITQVNAIRANDNQPPVKIVGLTATPYRTDITYRREIGREGYPVLVAYPTIKLINRTKSPFWSRLIYNINNADLLAQGFLTPLNYVDFSTIPQEEMPMNKSKTDFDLDAIEKKFVKWDDNIIKAINHGRTLSKSGSVLVFCSSIAQCKRLKEVYGDASAVVHALTPKDERKDLVDRFRAGTLPIMLNMGVFTLGFDHPALDCIVLGRPTQSIGLYYQMLGRGTRIAPGKDFCHVIDITNTVKKLGRIETIRMEKEAGSWQLISETGYWHNACLYKFEIHK